MSDITSDILTLSFDSLSSPSIELKLPEQLQTSHPLGWGIAWYPSDHQAAIVSKDPAARGMEVQMDALSDWANFRSTVYFCKAQGAARGYTHHETQPFSRSFAGQDWIFLHNGDLDKARLRELHKDKSRFLEPLGKTDSELAFCYLLGKMMETDARKLSDVPNETLLHWFEQIDPLGSADICISDGITSACFCGTNSVRKLYYTRLTPPEPPRVFNSESALLYLNDPRDTYRTTLIITSCQFDNGQWITMQPGQLLIVRRGAIVWNNKPEAGQHHDGTTAPLNTQVPMPLPPQAGQTQAVASIHRQYPLHHPYRRRAGAGLPHLRCQPHDRISLHRAGRAQHPYVPPAASGRSDAGGGERGGEPVGGRRRDPL